MLKPFCRKFKGRINQTTRQLQMNDVSPLSAASSKLAFDRLWMTNCLDRPRVTNYMISSSSSYSDKFTIFFIRVALTKFSGVRLYLISLLQHMSIFLISNIQTVHSSMVLAASPVAVLMLVFVKYVLLEEDSLIHVNLASLALFHRARCRQWLKMALQLFQMVTTFFAWQS